MNYRQACTLSPNAEAIRVTTNGRYMYRRANGDAYVQQKPHYTLYRDCRKREANGFRDWKPVGYFELTPSAFTKAKNAMGKKQYGWLSPSGQFYECEYTGHLLLAENIIHQRYVPHCAKRNTEGLYAVVADEDLVTKYGWAALYVWGWRTPAQVTQRMYDRMFDWSQVTGDTMPAYIEDLLV